MSLQLNDIYEPIKDDLAAVEEGLKQVGISDSPWLNELLSYALKGGGKRLRPALAILSAGFYDYNLERVLPLAMSVELMHMATLVHDDTIDNSSVRWGRPTVNKIWGMAKAVLLGDYLFAKSGELTAATENIRCIKLLPQTLMIITNGELAQAASSFKLNQTREHYFFRISCKTAALFVLATESGAVLSQAPEKSIQVIHDYGHSLGVAFQMVDDILDFTATEEEMGKPVGSDLDQGTLTLPAMMLVERYPKDNPVKRLFGGGDKEENITRAIEMVRNSSIIQDCFDIATKYKVRACQDLKLLPDLNAREVLSNLADYIVARRR
ncbi:MAG: polyprenyl synthetase family protein [Dehalococcoidia bacterium]|nr:polyprenyl synthetase family protein [Dehalococcoidia bacterium]